MTLIKPTIFINYNAAHHIAAGEAFGKGLQAHGIEPEYKSTRCVGESDLAVFWGCHNRHLIETQEKIGKPYIVMEAGYFGDRLSFVSLGYNGLNGHADFKNSNSPSDRWEKHGWNVKNWNNGGDYILICGQVPGDASIKHLDLKQEYQRIADELKGISKRPIRFRQHPKAGPGVNPQGIDASTASLEDDLESAHIIVTINSNTGVDAVLNGVPSITLDQGAMAWNVSGHELLNVLLNNRCNREQWLADLAYCQWKHKEIETGEAWEHLCH